MARRRAALYDSDHNLFFSLYSAKIGGLFTSEIIYPKRSKPKVSSLRLTEAATIL